MMTGKSFTMKLDITIFEKGTIHIFHQTSNAPPIGAPPPPIGAPLPPPIQVMGPDSSIIRSTTKIILSR
jgi:hypothetical protein